MEAPITIVIMFGIGIILASLIILFVHQWDLNRDVGLLQTLSKNQDEGSGLFKQDKPGFASEARKYWDSCNQSMENETKAFYVIAGEGSIEGSFTKKELFDYYKSLSWCGGIQSLSNNCGTREDVSMNDITLPAIVKLRCKDKILYIY